MKWASYNRGVHFYSTAPLYKELKSPKYWTAAETHKTGIIQLCNPVLVSLYSLLLLVNVSLVISKLDIPT